MRRAGDVTPGQFALFRVLFGAYLLQHFLSLLPDAAELFSNRGVLADPSLNPTHGLLPNPLAASWAGPGFATAFVAVLAGHLGIALTVDFADLTFGMVMIHLFTFDPAWLPVRADARRPVLLYDGECGLCNAVVRFLIREDRAGRLHFATMQSPPAQDFLRRRGLPARDVDSLVFVDDWNAGGARSGYRLRTAGVCAALDTVGGVWRPASWLRVLPAPARDACYKLVARLRYRLFGEYVRSPLPDPDWERRMVR